MKDRPLTELDRKLQEMALTNWAQFVQTVGEEAIIAAKVCLLRQSGKSYGEISVKLSITYDQARYGCKGCAVTP
jgi:hypothetical protein